MRIEVYLDTPWGKITSIDHTKNLRIIWKTYGTIFRHIKQKNYPHPLLEEEKRACRLILTSGDPKHNAFQFLKHKHLCNRLDKELSAMEIINNLMEMGEWEL